MYLYLAFGLPHHHPSSNLVFCIQVRVPAFVDAVSVIASEPSSHVFRNPVAAVKSHRFHLSFPLYSHLLPFSMTFFTLEHIP